MESPALTANLFRLDQRTIWVTGALGGLGVVLTMTLLEQGADVLCSDMMSNPPEPQWQIITDKAKEHGRTVKYWSLDIRNEDRVEGELEQNLAMFNPSLKGVLCCAGISGKGPSTTYPATDIRKILDVNVTGTFLCARRAARHMNELGVSGSIIMIASMSGTCTNQGVDTAAYNASKSALLQLARSFAAEWGSKSGHPPIRVNTLSPGYIRTDATGPTLKEMPHLEELWSNGNMLGRLSSPHEYRAPVVFLLSDANSFMTGSDLRVDGGHCAW